jgi:hypothetical protein
VNAGRIQNPEVRSLNLVLAKLQSVENEPLTLNREWFFVLRMSVGGVLLEVFIVSYQKKRTFIAELKAS